MESTLIDLGIFQISWYSIFILTGILIGGTLVLREAQKFKLNSDFMTNLIFWLVILGVIGSRAYYVIFNWSYYSSNWIDIFKIWEGGLAFHGALIAGILFVIIYAKKYKVRILMLTDIFVVGAIIGQAIGRWGNFFNQEAHGGVVTRSFLESLHLPEFIINGMNIYGIYYHPTFLYESIWCLLGFVFLMLLKKYKYLKLGQLTGAYFMWYSFGRFFIEMLRTDSLMIGPFKMAQAVSVLLFIIGIIIIVVNGKDSKFENLYTKGSEGNVIRF